MLGQLVYLQSALKMYCLAAPCAAAAVTAPVIVVVAALRHLVIAISWDVIAQIVLLK